MISSGHLSNIFLPPRAGDRAGAGGSAVGRVWREPSGNPLDRRHARRNREGVSPDKPVLGRRLAVLSAAWQDAKSEAALVAWLDRLGVRDVGVVRRLHRVLGDRAMEAVAANPYVMVPLLPWKQMDELGRRILMEDGRDPASDPRRHVGAADEAVKRMLRRGDTATTPADFTDDLAALLGPAPNLEAALAAARINGAVLTDGDLLRAPGAAALEDDLVARLKTLSRRRLEPRLGVMKASRWSEMLADMASPGKPLHADQSAAAVGILSRPLTLPSSAAPGAARLTPAAWCATDGSVSAATCCCARSQARPRFGCRVRPAGPSVRWRGPYDELAEREELETLLTDPDTTEDEARKAKLKLEGLSRITDTTLVVVDETSMVDLPGIHSLVRKLRPDSRLLMVGDPAQLPPIGFGLVFHKFAEDTAVTVRLTQVHRQAALTGIPAAAAAIRAGDVTDFADHRGPASGISFVDAHSDKLATVLDGTVVRLGDPADVLVVTATIGGAAGVDAINERFHCRHVAAAGCDELQGFFGRRFSVGEPVIFGCNDYRAGLFNGLLGRVTALDFERRAVTVMFDGDSEPKVLADEHLPDLDLAYAVTCHKAQGSSAKRIVVPVYASRVLDRSWLYTAVTRAEEQVVLVGSREVFRACVAKPPAAERRKAGLQWP